MKKIEYEKITIENIQNIMIGLTQSREYVRVAIEENE